MNTMWAYFPLKESSPPVAVTNFPGGRGPLVLLVGVGDDANTRRAQKATCPRREKNMGDARGGRTQGKTGIGRHLYV